MSKVSLFITLVGSETYNLLKNLIYPEKTETKLFRQNVTHLKKHLCPKKLIFAEQIKFYKLQQ